jgi:hypothetical protein
MGAGPQDDLQRRSESHRMRRETRSTPKQQATAITRAYVSCLCMGVACLAWGLAPAVVERIITGNTPRPELLAAGGLTAAVGAVFFGLHFFVRRSCNWALWAALSVAVVMFGFSIPTVFAHSAGAVSSTFLPMLAACVAATNWLALRRSQQAPVRAKNSTPVADWRQHTGVSHLMPSFAQTVRNEQASSSGSNATAAIAGATSSDQ